MIKVNAGSIVVRRIRRRKFNALRKISQRCCVVLLDQVSDSTIVVSVSIVTIRLDSPAVSSDRPGQVAISLAFRSQVILFSGFLRRSRLRPKLVFLVTRLGGQFKTFEKLPGRLVNFRSKIVVPMVMPRYLDELH